MSDLVTRVLYALAAGVITGLVALLVIAVVSALLPGISIDASFWATVLGVIAALLTFFTGSARLR